jgi:ribosomal protein S18 acetylase RimI-like enzyme
MLSPRPIDIASDREFVMAMRSLATFENDYPGFLPYNLASYRARWQQTDMAQVFIDELTRSLQDDQRTIAEVWEEDGRPVAFLWVRFSNTDASGVVVAEIKDIAVLPTHQRIGIGTLLLQHAETLARERGAEIMRSETAVKNEASQVLYRKLGFSPDRVRLEKALSATA